MQLSNCEMHFRDCRLLYAACKQAGIIHHSTDTRHNEGQTEQNNAHTRNSIMIFEQQKLLITAITAIIFRVFWRAYKQNAKKKTHFKLAAGTLQKDRLQKKHNKKKKKSAKINLLSSAQHIKSANI